ncbi:uncharacterized protein [Nicotiana sylvestris]|uniref:uncharacterized protein n=1 Tax=Nicotiana sylvestris TaxID=4096 RepID=UPI00388CB4F4
MFGPIIDVLDAIAVNARFEEKYKAKGYLKACLTFETDQLQELRKKGWDSLINEVSKFCMKYDISIPEFDELYAIPGRSRRRVVEYTISHHYRVEVSNLRGLGNLSTKLVETKKHGTYPLIFQLVKFALLLPVATATVERAFSAIKLIKTDLRSRMDDEFLSSCLVPYIEKDVFSIIPNEAVMNTFQNMKTR